MNIAIILPYLKAGGTERQASYIANDLQSKGHRVTLICVEKNETFLGLFRVPVQYLNSTNSNLKILNNIKRLSDTLESIKANVVISRAWSVNLLASKAASKAGIASVLFLSGSTDLSNHSIIKRKIHKHILGAASKIISVSYKAKENCIKWLQIDEQRINVVHNGVDIEDITKKADSDDLIPDFLSKIQAPIIVFVGRLIHRKGLDLLLKSVSSIINTGQHLELIVVGDGNEKPTYVKMAQELGISKSVHFVGEQKNPFPFMKIADIFVLPSRSEGFPNVLLEAMALGLPVIATDCATGPGEILNGRNGLLAVAESSESISKKLIKLINSDNLKVEIAKNAQSTVKESFNLKNQLNRIERVILEAVSEKF